MHTQHGDEQMNEQATGLPATSLGEAIIYPSHSWVGRLKTKRLPSCGVGRPATAQSDAGPPRPPSSHGHTRLRGADSDALPFPSAALGGQLWSSGRSVLLEPSPSGTRVPFPWPAGFSLGLSGRRSVRWLPFYIFMCSTPAVSPCAQVLDNYPPAMFRC